MLSLMIYGFIILALLLLPKAIKFWRIYHFAQTIPGPSIKDFIVNARKGQTLEYLKELRRKHGPTFRIWLGKDLTVFFTDPEDIKKILGDHLLLVKSNNYKLLKPWLGKGLLTNGGNYWRRRRKLLAPSFHFKILGEFKEPMEENCKILIRCLEKHANGKPFDIYPYVNLFALDVICETALGIKKNAQLQSDSDYVEAVQHLCSILHKQLFSFWYRFKILFNLSGLRGKRDAAIKILHYETNRLIKLRKKWLAKLNIQHVEDVEMVESTDNAKRRLAFLDMLLITQMETRQLSDRDIREEVDTFMFEGHHTTSSALGFIIYLLSQHEEVQQKAYEECEDSQGYEKESLPYLEAVIKESLRLYPSVPFFSRKVTKDITIGNLNVPKGVSLSTLAYMAHRDESHFPDPEKFDPERFLSEEHHLHPFSFVAFSAGPRICIGQKFAMLELKLALSYLLRSFEILPVEDFVPNPVADIVTTSENGIQIRLSPRK